jgi:putative MATE family efflux protein
MNRSSSHLTEGPIVPALLKLAFPMMIAFGFQTSFNFVDRYFISRLGDTATAAIGMAFVVQLILIALGSGVGMGLNSFISRNLGAGKKETAVSAALHSFLLAVGLGVGLGVLGLLVQRPLFLFLGARGDLLEGILSYLTVLFYFAPVYLLSMISNNIFRGWGDTVHPMKFMMTGTLLNIVLDPIFIFGVGPIPGMGLKGAALATGLARTFSFLYTLLVLVLKKKPAPLPVSYFRLNWKIVRGIFQVGFPSSLAQILNGITLMLVYFLLKRFGTEPKTAYTIAYTYEVVVFLPVMGLAQAMAIMVGHNYGSGNYPRIRQIYFAGLRFSLMVMAILSGLILLVPRPLAAVFARSQRVLEMTIITLKILAPGYLFRGVFMCTIASFQGIGLGSHQLMAMVVKMVGMLLPFAYWGAIVWGVEGVWWGIFAANALSAVVMLIWFYWLYHRRLIRGKIVTM